MDIGRPQPPATEPQEARKSMDTGGHPSPANPPRPAGARNPWILVDIHPAVVPPTFLLNSAFPPLGPGVLEPGPRLQHVERIHLFVFKYFRSFPNFCNEFAEFPNPSIFMDYHGFPNFSDEFGLPALGARRAGAWAQAPTRRTHMSIRFGLGLGPSI